MMIDRKTALVCAALIALMLAAAVTRIMILDDWPRQASLSEALRIWQFFALPFIAAMLVMSRYANGRQATAVEARIEPCCHWGELLSIDVCLCVLLMQGLQIATSLGPHVPLFAVVAAGAAIVAAEAMNRNQRGLHDTGPETALGRAKEELDQPFIRAGSFSDRIHAALHERRLARLSFRCAGPVSAAPAILARSKVRLAPVTW
jgi:hypothetical protein